MALKVTPRFKIRHLKIEKRQGVTNSPMLEDGEVDLNILTLFELLLALEEIKMQVFLELYITVTRRVINYSAHRKTCCYNRIKIF